LWQSQIGVLFYTPRIPSHQVETAAMATTDVVTQDRAHQIQDFIFARELAEVYLLLDHLSGRSDKTLTTVISEEKIKEICEICWPPKGTTIEQAAQAATLMLAKDALNTAAMPANSASIAFTLLVVGDEDPTAVQRKRTPEVSRWLRVWRGAENPPVAVKGSGGGRPNAPEDGGARNSPLPQIESANKNMPVAPNGGPGGGNGTGNSGSPPNPFWNGEPPSRLSLARCAYPGLIRRAALFNFSFKYIIIPGLFLWLILTCFLSWDIAAGHAILARLDAIETTKIAIRNKIAAAEATPSAPLVGEPPASAAKPTQDPSGLSKPLRVVRFCDRPQLLLPAGKTNTGIDIPQFDDVTERQICDEFTEINRNYSDSREDVADWLAPWRFVKYPSHQICGGEHCLKVDMNENDQQWAVIMVQVLTTAVLPLFYGILGAGAAVVRIIWGKMRDSLLTPRDLTLSLGQLALGAVIGACIGLFIVPSGNGSQSAIGLVGVGTLTPSAVSFIAGFGVEGVFVTLESLIKRLFNVPDPKP
jgi:hypothetical protein